MFDSKDLKERLGKISAKTLSSGGKELFRTRNERKIKFSEEFTYSPLSDSRCIRLVKIHKGAETDILSCDLCEANLEKEPIFHALSYSWDLDPHFSAWDFAMVPDKKKEERPILCNGKVLHITMNLYNAMLEFRRQERLVPTWADQISINQHDEEEKIAQLSIMADIFSSASTVIVWLGLLNSVRNNALDFMEELPETKLPDTLGTLEQNPLSGPENMGKFDLKSLRRPLHLITTASSSVGNHYHWFGAVYVLARQWFSRGWTLQEFLLSKEVVFLMGNREISSAAIIKTARQLCGFYSSDPLSIQVGLNVTMISLRRFIEGRAKMFEEREKFQNGKRYTAEEYLGVVRARKCSVRKDKVFAGTALLEPGKSLKANYHSTTLEVYISFAHERLWPETGVFMLSLVGGTMPDTEGLPSWIPDLNGFLRPEPLRYCSATKVVPLISSRTDDCLVDGRTLNLMVAQWDVVEEVGESIWSWTKYDDEAYNADPIAKMRTSGSVQRERFGLMFKLLEQLGPIYSHTGERITDVFWQTLIGGIETTNEEDFALWRTRFQNWFAFTLGQMRANFYLEKTHSGNKLMTASAPKKWMTPLIAEWTQMENRVAAFLDFHDQNIGNVAVPAEQPLRKTISAIAKRVWGTDSFEKTGILQGSQGSMAGMYSTVADQEFYGPISLFGDRFVKFYDGRRIFVTKNGYLGAGIEDVKAGDVICLVRGSDVPYILRPSETSEDSYTLVGEAFFHGIMSDATIKEDVLDFKKVKII
ncbi:hypothetical protein BT63DRAFT_452349 [Microthyrium microscopicum]|uniref:Heterokaryon incompatibility domain-containing protein n=1 Tax=Microthyrium microscopicum TaxID=703497 RepID=A0A6A6UI25_9PEZI|nr:hypothetical protein BT63DRAFT_452349 [Microthyrium microscopicum]